MKLLKIGKNMTELQYMDGVIVLYSYQTPVAAFIPHNKIGFTHFYVTSRKFSRTTSKHIKKWLGPVIYEEKPQEFFDSLVGEL